MGEVLMQPMGGGIGSDDVTAAKAHVLAGHNTVTTDSDDEVVEGTMPDRGQWQYGKSLVHANGYYAMNQLPEGYYHADGATWAPEIRMEDAVAKQSQMWSDAYSAGVSDADSRVNRNSASYNSGYWNGKQAVLGGCRIERISMSQYGSHSGTKTFGSNGYIYVAGVLMHGKQVYSGVTATCKVTLNGGVIAQCSATTEDNFGDNSPGYSSFSTNFVRYYANNNITASVTGDNGRMACDVFIVFIPD